MKIFLDTTQSKIAIGIFDNNFKLINSKIEEQKYKVESLISFFKEKEIDLSKINEIFINIGPGNFTGCRIALIYSMTISQLSSSCILKKINSFKMLSFFTKQVDIKIPINKTKAYSINRNLVDNFTNEDIDLVEWKKEEYNEEINYEYLLNNFSEFKEFFSPTNSSDIKPLYISEDIISKGNN